MNSIYSTTKLGSERIIYLNKCYIKIFFLYTTQPSIQQWERWMHLAPKLGLLHLHSIQSWRVCPWMQLNKMCILQVWLTLWWCSNWPQVMDRYSVSINCKSIFWNFNLIIGEKFKWRESVSKVKWVKIWRNKVYDSYFWKRR